MTKLKKFQNDFLNAYQTKDMTALRCFISDDTPTERLDIYRSSITGGLIKTLKHTYEACNILVGEEFFNALAEVYINQTASTPYDLNEYGADFASFVANFEHAKSIPYLADICRMSWAHHNVALHPGDKMFDSQQFRSLSENTQYNTVLKIPSSAIFVTSKYPLLDIWQLCYGNSKKEITITNNKIYHFIIWRQQMTIKIENLTATDIQIFKLLKKQLSLHKLEKEIYKQQLNPYHKLTKFIQNGWICDYTEKHLTS